MQSRRFHQRTGAGSRSKPGREDFHQGAVSPRGVWSTSPDHRTTEVSGADPAHHEGLALSGGMLVAIGSLVRSTGLSVEYVGQSRMGWDVEEASVIVQQLRANAFALTVTGPELSGLIAAARLALDFVSQDAAAPAEARELLARLLRDYEQAMAPESGNGGH